MFIVVTDNECDSSEVIFVSSKAKDYIFFLFSNSFNLILAPHNHANHFERVRGEHSTSENDVSELDTFYVPEWGSSQSI